VRLRREVGNEPLLSKRDKPINIVCGIVDEMGGQTDKRHRFTVCGGEFESKGPQLESCVLQSGKDPGQGGETIDLFFNFRFQTCRE